LIDEVGVWKAAIAAEWDRCVFQYEIESGERQVGTAVEMRGHVVDGEGVVHGVVCYVLVGGSDVAEVEIVKVIDVVELVVPFELHCILTGGEEYGGCPDIG
jgi:hypothetical protein